MAQHQIATVEKQIESDKETYTVLLNSGYAHLNNGRLDHAQRDFAYALRVFPYDVKANTGMKRTLQQHCASNHKYCKEAETYAKLVKTLSAVSKSDN